MPLVSVRTVISQSDAAHAPIVWRSRKYLPVPVGGNWRGYFGEMIPERPIPA
jgi:hypothetical protein